MKILKSTRGIVSNRLTKIDPNKTINEEILHAFPNLDLLSSLSIKNGYLKAANKPLETYLMIEEW